MWIKKVLTALVDWFPMQASVSDYIAIESMFICWPELKSNPEILRAKVGGELD